jgi:hypothetical protein
MRNFERAKVRPKTTALQPSTRFGYNYEPLLDDAEMVEFLGGLHLKTLQRMARNEALPFYRVRRHYFYVTAELDSEFKPEEEIA